MKTFQEFLNEGFYSIKNALTGHDTAKFVVSSLIDKQGFFIQFLPDSETSDKFTNDQLKKIIKTSVFDKMPKGLSNVFVEHIGKQDAAGILFKMDSFELLDYIRTFFK